MTTSYKIGIDLGGTKTLGVILNTQGQEIARQQCPTPAQDYQSTIRVISEIVTALEKTNNQTATIGIGIPGSVSPRTGKIQNANSTWLNGKDFKKDLETALGRSVRLANDANCFAISEAIDGAGKDAHSLFGVILGTGCGGGFVLQGKLLDGPHGIAGEWGHTPLPWLTAEEYDGPTCWCDKQNCLETWLSGPALSADHKRHTQQILTAEDIAALAMKGNRQAQASLDRHANRLARGLATVVNILDPEIIVLGGGLSNMAHLYSDVPQLLPEFVFSDHFTTKLKAPKHGATSGVRGAAWLWDS